MPQENPIGRVVGGCQILAEIAQGGMGVIYRAKQLSLDREVAIKILADHLAGDPKFVERFQREARAIARINHPNILAVYDVGHDSELGVPYMIMELIDGASLSTVIQERGVLPVEEAGDYVRQAALGFACAQGAGIIHRDIKPENIMLTKQKIVKVSDFGLAKEISGQDITVTDAVMGTPAYMSPEQCDGKTLDGRSDVYSLGGTFYRLITGRLPFESGTAMSMMYRHKHEPLTPPSQIVPTTPSAVSDLIVKMMAKRREDRFDTMEAVVAALDQALSQPQATDTRKTLIYGGRPEEATAGSSTLVAQEPAPTRRPEIERLLAQGDVRHKRGDLAGAARLWREARAIEPDERVVERLQRVVQPEVARARGLGEEAVHQGKLEEAVKLFRRVLELDPGEQALAERVAELEERFARQREAVNQVRQLLAADRLDDAVAAWDGIPQQYRDATVAEQIGHVRDVVLPVRRLCDSAEEAMKSGDPERALKLYSGALSVDQGSERAQRGAREVERRLTAAEKWLKEGYQHSVKGDINRSIQSWSKILGEIPGHSQARKLIVDARLKLGHDFRSREGGRAQAIEQWKEILKLDPEHREAADLLEHDRSSLESLTRLGDRAGAAFRSGRYAQAVSSWQQMLDIDPTDRRLAQSLEEAKRLALRRRLVRFAAAGAAVVALLGAGQLLREYLVLRQMESVASGGTTKDAGDAAKVLDGYTGPRWFLRGPMKRRYDFHKYRYLFATAEARLKGGDLDQAARLFEAARPCAEGDEREIEEGLKRVELVRCLRRAEAALARATDEYRSAATGFFTLDSKLHDIRGYLAEAAAEYGSAAEVASSLGPTARAEALQADEGAKFIGRVSDAVASEAADGRGQARGLWRSAAELRPEAEIVKLGQRP